MGVDLSKVDWYRIVTWSSAFYRKNPVAFTGGSIWASGGVLARHISTFSLASH